MIERSQVGTGDGSGGDSEPGATAQDSRSAPLASTFGTAAGAAMLGFEQAFRREPPAEVMAAEHAPERGQIGLDGGLIIEIPGPSERR